MNLRSGGRRRQRVSLFVGAVGFTAILGSYAVPAASASPASPASGPISCGTGCANITENYPGAADKCIDINPNADWCLWYSPNYENGVWAYTGGAASVPVITANFTDGDGAVRNNAASAANIGGCEIGIFVSPNYVGDVNYLGNDGGGNLTESPPLRNNEASIKIFCD
jgi:hypothetical protein